MQINNSISNLLKGITNAGPLNKLAKLGRAFLDKLTQGRGLKLWSKPAIREIKSKDEFSEFQLENGLKVIFKESKGTELDLSLKIHSGSTKDPKGKEGLAHFLEHIVIHNTKDFGEDIDHVAKLNGAYVNAYTGFDETVYPLTFPKDKLDVALRILRAYMSPLDYDDKVLKKEKGVVCSELKMHESQPSRKPEFKFLELLFGAKHPLARDIGGTSKAVNSITKDDLDKFFSSEYVPNNATLVISGEVDKFKAKEMIKRYFSDLKPNPNLQKLDHSKTIQPSNQRECEMKDDAFVSFYKFAYRIPKFNHKDELICSLISEALTRGNNSRLQRKLVDGEAKDGKASALFVSSGANTNKDYGYFRFSIKPLDENREANLAKIEKILQEELDGIAKNGLEDKEFKRLINKLEADEVYKQDFQHSSIGAVAEYLENGQDWQLALQKLKDIRNITNEDVKDFVAKYLTKSNRHSIKVIGKGSSMNEEFVNSLKDKMPDDSTNLDKEKGLTPEKLEKALRLSKGPSNLTVSLNDLQKIQLANGMQVYLKEDHSLPLVIGDFSFEGGTLAIPDEMKASQSMLNSLLAETGSYNPKTGRRLDKKEIEELKVKLGARFGQGSSIDHSSVYLSTLSKNLDETLALMNEVFNNPAILETNNPEVVKSVQEEFERIKQKDIDLLEVFKKFPGVKASEEFSRSIYPKGHLHYAKGIDEAIREIKNIKLEDLRQIYKKLFHAKNAKLTVVGDINQKQVEEKLVSFLDSWNKENQSIQRKPDFSRIAPVEAKKAKISIIKADDNKPESTVIIGNPSEIVKDSPEYFPSMLANIILGSGFSSRLVDEVRENKGLVYHIGSMLTTMRKGCGPFIISLGCDPRNTKKSIASVLATVKKFLDKGVTEHELELAKSEIKKSFAMGAFNSRAATCGTLSGLQLRDKDESFVNNFNSMIDAITVDQVNSAARKFIKPGNFTIVATKPKDFKFEALAKASEKKPVKAEESLALAA